MKYLSIVCIAVLAVSSAWGMSSSELYENSKCWPVFCHLVDSIELGGRTVAKGARGVLIRIEAGGGHAWVDFGRRGLCRVATTSTDLLERAQLIESGISVKRYPNIVELIGSRMIRVHNGQATRLSVDDFLSIKGFICIRFTDTEEGWSSVARWRAKQGGAFTTSGKILLLLPEGENVSDTSVYECILEYGLEDACYLYTFLSGSYRKLLWCGLQELDAAHASVIELNAEGRLLYSDELELPSL